MTEGEWLACQSAADLLEHSERRLSARRLRLAVCACLRAPTVWPWLVAPGSRRAVEVAELFADGLTNERELELAKEGARGAPDLPGIDLRAALAALLAHDTCRADGELLEWGVLDFARCRGGEFALVADRVRDVLGNPFRAPPGRSGAWPTPAVIDLAATAYGERGLPSGELDPQRLAVLADALEEAGCCDEVILGHLRSPGPHVRGCRALDLVLGKECGAE